MHDGGKRLTRRGEGKADHRDLETWVNTEPHVISKEQVQLAAGRYRIAF